MLSHLFNLRKGGDEKFFYINKLQGRLSKIFESPLIVGKEHQENVNHR